MTMKADYDAIVIGSGPNGLAAAITMARAGCRVRVYEGGSTVGGGMRTLELTLPGFQHDICSAIHPLGFSSPFFTQLPLEKYGLEWVHPDVPLAHPFEDGTGAALYPSVEATAETLGPDAARYRQLMQPLAVDWEKIAPAVLGPLRLPSHPLALARFGFWGVRSTRNLVHTVFKGERAQAFFAGLAAHSILPMEKAPSAAFGLVLGMVGHRVGWPLPRGGSQKIADALAAYLVELGGEIFTDVPVTSLYELPSARAYLFNTAPRQMLDISGDRLPERYHRHLRRFRHGPGVFKIDWALSEPVPWRAEVCRHAGTIHLGPSFEEIALSERVIWNQQHCDRPYVLLAQQSLFDDTRAPDGQHTLWAYCHVPAGSTVDMTGAIEQQIERFAPGFQDCILARHTLNTAAFQAYNPNYVNGDITGGIQDFQQLFTRPAVRLNPYTTPAPDIYLCSASTPPGGGVHGMAGYHAAMTALRRLR